MIPVSEVEQKGTIKSEVDESELVKLAYQAVTLNFPSDEMLSILSVVGIKRILEILLIMQQAPTVQNPYGTVFPSIFRSQIRAGFHRVAFKYLLICQ